MRNENLLSQNYPHKNDKSLTWNIPKQELTQTPNNCQIENAAVLCAHPGIRPRRKQTSTSQTSRRHGSNSEALKVWRQEARHNKGLCWMIPRRTLQWYPRTALAPGRACGLELSKGWGPRHKIVKTALAQWCCLAVCFRSSLSYTAKLETFNECKLCLDEDDTKWMEEKEGARGERDWQVSQGNG